ncbi:MAG: AAA family ATPase [Muribaculaceae bacterium]|nr:AAA family ATPase [Muribaculaceae bacterium]
MKLSEEQEEALNEMLSGKNVFLTGEAGTGKSTIVKEFKRRTSKNCVFLAPTGIAAVNVGGSTIHSFLRLVPGLMAEDSIEPIGNKKQRELIRNVEVVIIDEISMVRSDLFWAVDYRLRQVASGVNKRRPFGGKQVILVGDFYQLPPVVKSEEEERFIKNVYGGELAFQTETWLKGNFTCFCLKTVHRQGSDNLFLTVLNHIRHNDMDSRDIRDPETGEMLNVKEMLNKSGDITRPLSVTPVCLCTTNREANILNALANEQTAGTGRTFAAIVKGVFSEKDYPTPAKLELKTGTRVMTLINHRTPSGDLEYVNGDVGEVLGFVNQSGVDSVRIKLDNGKRVIITPNEWKNYLYVLTTDAKTGKEKVTQKEVGSYIQLPLKPAYAMTIHKSQGMSVDAVLIKLGNGCFAHGQLYTALSRCRSLKNLRIDRAIYAEDVIINAAVVDFYRSIDVQKQEEDVVVKMDIPAEYRDAVEELLKKLRGETTIPEQPAKIMKTSKKVSRHPDLDHLVIVYKNQTMNEKSKGLSQKRNGIGFNKHDAPILTAIAENYLEYGFVFQDDFATVSRLIPKYHAQWGE